MPKICQLAYQQSIGVFHGQIASIHKPLELHVSVSQMQLLGDQWKAEILLRMQRNYPLQLDFI